MQQRKESHVPVKGYDEAWLMICIKLEIVSEEVKDQDLSLGGEGRWRNNTHFKQFTAMGYFKATFNYFWGTQLSRGGWRLSYLKEF
jgi:hypothetical protein